MAKTLIRKITEGPRATNIYLDNEAALHLAHRLIRQAEKEAGVRVVILNKGTQPDFQVYAYAVDRMRA